MRDGVEKEVALLLAAVGGLAVGGLDRVVVDDHLLEVRVDLAVRGDVPDEVLGAVPRDEDDALAQAQTAHLEVVAVDLALAPVGLEADQLLGRLPVLLDALPVGRQLTGHGLRDLELVQQLDELC